MRVFLQEVWACWCELLSYLEQENTFLDQLEQKLDETENMQGGAEELQEALDVRMRTRGSTLFSLLLNKKRTEESVLVLFAYTELRGSPAAPRGQQEPDPRAGPDSDGRWRPGRADPAETGRLQHPMG